MPSKSKAQHNFMAAVANNPSFAKKVGVPRSVGKDFSNADKGKTFKRGGDMPIKAKAQSLDDMKKDAISSSVAERGYKKGGMPMKMKDGKKMPIFMNKGGMAASSMGKVKTAAPSKDGVAIKGKTKGKMITMSKGGKAMKSGGRTC
tara:strand:+ start:182 stop:619 length:438 start_codon:yes stop_codon:yes gene_type:complete